MNEVTSFKEYGAISKTIIRLHMSRIGTFGGKMRSEKKRKACAENAKKRWAKVREQARQAEPGK